MWKRRIGIGVVIAALVLGALIVGPMAGTLAYFYNAQVTGNHSLSTWQCILWLQTTKADFDADTAVNVSTSAIPGSVILDNWTTFPSVYAMHGNTGTAFSLFNMSNGTWVSVANTAGNVVDGGALAYTGNDNIFAFQGSGTNTFWQYNISTNTWMTKTNTPASIGTGAALAYTGNGNISALRGGGGAGGGNDFWQYNITSNSWSQFANTPANVGNGAALAYTGNGNISALRGGGNNDFWQYNISTNTWTTKANTPASVGNGGALAYTGDGNISALRGAGGAAGDDFWRYNISTNTWTIMQVTPARVGNGAALAYTGDGNISALRGGDNSNFWQYNITSNSWSAFADTPASVAAGGSLAYVPANPSVFKSAGTLSSVVNNSGKAGTTWNSLIWNSTITSAVTNITFQVRANDTSFLPTDSSPSWINAGWPSPVNTGLPTGRYFQWRAILTTTNTGQTPILYDVSLCYT